MLAYIFERFPKFSQTFCYREVVELVRQGVSPYIFSLRAPELAQEQDWRPEILSSVHHLPEGDAFAALADRAQGGLSRDARRILRQWRGQRDSLRLHQAAYIGMQLQALEVTHVHTHFAGMAARTAYWICRFFGIPFSVTVHANDIFKPNDFKIGLPEIFESARAIIAVSEFAATYLRDKFPEAAAKIHRVYNGVDLNAFPRATLARPPLVLSVGRLIHKKGFDVLIDACALLDKTNFRCEIVGDGPLRDQLQAQISERNLNGRVLLVGAKTERETAARLGAAAVFALPCRVETDGAMDNLPTVIMEAMASSLPVVSTEVGGVSEMVRDGQTGIVVAQNDARAVANALATLLRDEEGARELGARGRERCAELFSVEENVGMLRQIIL